jgi:hypothetical protein
MHVDRSFRVPIDIRKRRDTSAGEGSEVATGWRK